MKTKLLLLTLLQTIILQRFESYKDFKDQFNTFCSPLPKKKIKFLDLAQEDLEIDATNNKKIFIDQPYIFLGKGGYSRVFLDTSNENVVKVIKPKKLESLTSLYSIKKEIIFGFDYFFKTRKKGGVKKCAFNFKRKQNVFMITLYLDYLKGDDMNFYNKSFLTEDRELQSNLYLFKELNLLVKEYHDMGYIHRDIKPSNFFLEKEQTQCKNTNKKKTKNSKNKKNQKKLKNCDVLKPYLIDLALAIKYKYCDIYYGTRSYMANEMINDDWYNNTIDVYSLGVSFLEFLRLDIKNLKIDMSLIMIIEAMLMDNYCFYFKEFQFEKFYNLKMVFCDNSDFYWEYQFTNLEEMNYFFFDLKKNYCTISEIVEYRKSVMEIKYYNKNLNSKTRKKNISYKKLNSKMIFWDYNEFNLIKCFDVDKNYNFYLTCRPSMKDLKQIFDIYYNWKFNNSKNMYKLYEKVFEKNIMFDYKLFLDQGFIGIMYRHSMPNVFKLLNSRRYFTSNFKYW